MSKLSPYDHCHDITIIIIVITRHPYHHHCHDITIIFLISSSGEKPGILDVFRDGIARLVSWSDPRCGRMLPVWVLVPPQVMLASHWSIQYSALIGPGHTLGVSLHNLHPGAGRLAPGSQGHSQRVSETHCKSPSSIIIILLTSCYPRVLCLVTPSWVTCLASPITRPRRLRSQVTWWRTPCSTPWRLSYTGCTSRAPGASSTTWTAASR